MRAQDASASAVRVYLQEEFRGPAIVDLADPGSRARTFRVDDPQGTPIALTTVSTEFLENLTPHEVMEALLRHDLAGWMRKAGPRVRVIVATTGLRTEPV